MSCSNQTFSFPFWINATFSVFFLFFSSFSALGQIDSLVHLAASLPEGEEKLEVWIDISNYYAWRAPEKALKYCDSIIVLGTKINDYRAIGVAQYNRASIDNDRGENLIALDKVKKAKHYFKEINSLVNLSNAYNLEGVIFLDLNNYKKASKSFLNSIKYAEIARDTDFLAQGYQNLGNTFLNLNNFSKAEEYYWEALRINEARNNYTNHAQIYNGLAISAPEGSKQDNELTFLKKALNFASQEQDTFQLIETYNNLGAYYFQENQIDQAKVAFQKNIQYTTDYNDQNYLGLTYSNLAILYQKINQHDSTIFYANKALEICEKHHLLRYLQDIYDTKADYYISLNKMDSAYTYLQKVLKVRDSIYNEDVQRQIQINADQFQLERKEKQLAEQELQLTQAANSRNRLMMFGILLLAIVAAIYQWYLARQRRRKQLAEFALAQQQAEADRLRELDQAKSNFFTNISHELRTPLSLILGPLSDVLREVKAIPIKDKLHTIQRNGKKLLDLVNEIMDLSKLESGKLELQNTIVDLIPNIKRIWGSFESLAATRRIKMHLDIAVEEVSVLLDRDKFEKILNNLLSNAIKFTPADGFIRLRVSKKAGLYHFEVKDTGSGIADDDQQKIFDRFFQAEHGKAQQGGTGVGLALAKELAKLMGGDIQVNSTLKEGSTFTFSLALTETDTKATIQEIATEVEQTAPIVFSPLSIQGQKPKVLVVEDHPEMGKYLIQSLGAQYDCILATDGLQALHQLKIHQFDAITSDVMMPNMDGFELRKKINENPVWKHIPFLLLTARHLESDKIKGFQLGVDDYVTKPFSNLELQARLHNLIRNKIERDKFMAAEFNAVDQNPTESVDQKFLKEVETEILRNLDREQYSVENLAKAIGYSSKQLSRILKKLTGLTTVNFILEVRLQKARTLLENRLVATVSEAQYEVGISSTSYFTRKFTERFGKNPRDML